MTMVNAFDAARTSGLGAADRALIARRAAALGPAYRLFYERPVHIVQASGVWLRGADGRQYLDAYNNVASVGHCHPRVVAAIAEQAARLNTHTRYLSEVVVHYAERLAETMPSPMHVMFTCTGSEANDLALRIARAATGGRGVIVTANAYHGVTQLLAGMSPSLGTGEPVADFVRLVPPPLPGRPGAADLFAQGVAEAAQDLRKAGHGPATLLLDTVLSSDGVLGTQPGILAPAVAAIHAAGGLFIADEVQPGLGRIGPDFWGFRYHGLAPDLVTCGKPMGNGHPVAMTAARPELAQIFGERVRYFNTFGGNPVSAAAGLAVLDVLADEALPLNAARTSLYLLDALRTLARDNARIVELRGVGLSIGMQLASPALATRIVNGMRERGVLISATGPVGDVLKIRPPLCFAVEHAGHVVSVLQSTLAAL